MSFKKSKKKSNRSKDEQDRVNKIYIRLVLLFGILYVIGWTLIGSYISAYYLKIYLLFGFIPFSYQIFFTSFSWVIIAIIVEVAIKKSNDIKKRKESKSNTNNRRSKNK